MTRPGDSALVSVPLRGHTLSLSLNLYPPHISFFLFKMPFPSAYICCLPISGKASKICSPFIPRQFSPAGPADLAEDSRFFPINLPSMKTLHRSR